MIRVIFRLYIVVTICFVASLVFAQAEFSAEVFNDKHPESQAKIYFGKEKARFEPGKKEAHGGGAVIVDMNKQSWTVLMDERQMYMEMPQQMMGQKVGYDFFHAQNVEDACPQWLQMSQNKGGTCHKVGNETVNGRSTVKYEGTNSKGETGMVWLDPKLRFPVKWQDKNGGGELRNIQEGSQASSLFEIPAGYKKFDMPNMGNMTQRPQ